VRRLLFPLLVLLVAGALWLLEQDPAGLGGGGAADGAGPGAGAPAPAAPAAEEGRRVLTPSLSAWEDPNAAPADGLHFLTIRFRAAPPVALAEAVCLLDLESGLGFGDQALEAGQEGEAWADAAETGRLRRAALGPNLDCRFRVPAGLVWPALQLGEERLELESFLMPEGNHLEVIDLGPQQLLDVLVLAAGEPVHPCRVELWGGNGIDEPRLLLAGPTAEDGSWRPRLVFGGIDHLRVTPDVPWLRQTFGPFPVEAGPAEWPLELPVAFLELISNVEEPGPTLIRRLPAPGSVYPSQQSEQIPVSALPVGRGEHLVVGPCDLFLQCSDLLLRFDGDPRLRAGTRARLEIHPVSVGELQVEIWAGGEPVLPAGVEWDLPPGIEPPLALEAATDLANGLSYSRRYRIAPGQYRLRLRSPLLLPGTNPPRYLIPTEKAWEADLTIEASRTQTLRFEWDGFDELLRVTGDPR